jgi:hypothetical protein
MSTWIYTDYNYDTETWDVIRQETGKEDFILRSFKREGDALNHELKVQKHRAELERVKYECYLTHNNPISRF